MPYLDRTCVIVFEFNDGLSAAGYLDLVLRTEPRHHFDCVRHDCWGFRRCGPEASLCLLLSRFGCRCRCSPNGRVCCGTVTSLTVSARGGG
jgi:hypothetical protein